MKLFSLFTGIGGLDYGLKDKVQLVGYSEIKESSIKIFENHYKGRNYGDIIKIDFNKLPDFDILIGGFPCQSFSLAGFREGFKDKRGKMIFYIYELLKIKKPRFVVLENVKGILSHNKGRTYRDVVKLLSNAGYFVRVILLNAINYGLAQSRERILFLCNKSDFEKKFLGVDEDKGSTKDLKSEDRVRLRNMAKEIAQNDYGAKYQKMSMNGVVGDQPKPKDYEVSEYDILKNLPRAAKFLYPNLMFDEFTETPGAVHPLDIQLPGTIKKASQAMDHLMKEYKMDEPQARQWIQERL